MGRERTLSPLRKADASNDGIRPSGRDPEDALPKVHILTRDDQDGIPGLNSGEVAAIRMLQEMEVQLPVLNDLDHGRLIHEFAVVIEIDQFGFLGHIAPPSFDDGMMDGRVAFGSPERACLRFAPATRALFLD